MWYFRLPPRWTWGVHSSRLLCSIRWLVADRRFGTAFRLQGSSIPLNAVDGSDTLFRNGLKQIPTQAAYSPKQRRPHLYTVARNLISAYSCPSKTYLCLTYWTTDYEYFHALACTLLTFATPGWSKSCGTFELATSLKTISTDGAFVRSCIEAVTSETVTPIKRGSKVKSQTTPYKSYWWWFVSSRRWMLCSIWQVAGTLWYLCGDDMMFKCPSDSYKMRSNGIVGLRVWAFMSPCSPVEGWFLLLWWQWI